jgi:hypothetical protein
VQAFHADNPVPPDESVSTNPMEEYVPPVGVIQKRDVIKQWLSSIEPPSEIGEPDIDELIDVM